MTTNIQHLISQMTLEEKAGLCSGLDFWHTKGIERLGIPSLMVTDGPHGLRKQQSSADHLGLHDSVPATCFPSAAGLASSWDRELIGRVGQALGAECQAENVAVLLGPGNNIKRSPLNGRNFEYFSEDPFLASEMAASHVAGVQSQGVGTSLKHFAANNQEHRRMNCTPIVRHHLTIGGAVFLSKFNLALKKEAIHQYLSGGEGVKSIARSLGVNHEVLRMWIKQYEYHGEKAFEKSYTAYTIPFKLDVLNYMNENGTSPNEAAVIFNISSPGVIRKWRSQFNAHGIDALKIKKKGRHCTMDKGKKGLKKQEPAEGSVEALQVEIERLRMENAYLKKLNALVQSKEKSPNKTNRK